MKLVLPIVSCLINQNKQCQTCWSNDEESSRALYYCHHVFMLWLLCSMFNHIIVTDLTLSGHREAKT